DDVEVRPGGVAEASALGLIVIPGLLELLDEQRADRHDGDAALPRVGERLGNEDLRQTTTAKLLIDGRVMEDPLGLGLGAGEEVGVAGDGAALDRDDIGPAVLVEADGDLGARRVRECLAHCSLLHCWWVWVVGLVTVSHRVRPGPGAAGSAAL